MAVENEGILAQKTPKALTRQEKEILRIFTVNHPDEENTKEAGEFDGPSGKEEYLTLDSLTGLPGERFALDIFSEPKAKSRPRVMRNGITFTPRETKEAQLQIGWLFRIKYPSHKVDELSNFGIRMLFRCSERQGRPKDVDNLIKLVLDGLNKVLYADDKQVLELVARVVRTKEQKPLTRIFAYTLKSS